MFFYTNPNVILNIDNIFSPCKRKITQEPAPRRALSNLIEPTQCSCANFRLDPWFALCSIFNLLVVTRMRGNKTEAVFLSAPPLVMSCHPLLGLRLCFPIMPSLPAGWFKQAVFFFSLSIIPCPAAAPCTLHTHRDGSWASRRDWFDFGV